MQSGNLQAASGRLQDALKELQLAWSKLADVWRDDNSRAIEQERLRPLAEEVNAAIPPISLMAQVLSQSWRELTE